MYYELFGGAERKSIVSVGLSGCQFVHASRSFYDSTSHAGRNDNVISESRRIPPYEASSPPILPRHPEGFLRVAPPKLGPPILAVGTLDGWDVAIVFAHAQTSKYVRDFDGEKDLLARFVVERHHNPRVNSRLDKKAVALEKA